MTCSILLSFRDLHIGCVLFASGIIISLGGYGVLQAGPAVKRSEILVGVRTDFSQRVIREDYSWLLDVNGLLA